MSKRELIDRIKLINRTVRPEFLEGFSENELSDYLRQLEGITDRVRLMRPNPRPSASR
jgi:hypothetical protein